jgi:hypothetical protein
MIDVWWSPANDIFNYRSPSQPPTAFYWEVSYKGVAYMMGNPVDDLESFLEHVNYTSGGSTAYALRKSEAVLSFQTSTSCNNTNNTISRDVTTLNRCC